MKERMQKTLAEVKGCPQKDRTESEGYVGAQTFMWICEDNIVEVPFDKEHLLERIISPDNLLKAYKAVQRNKGCSGIDKMSCEQMLPWLLANKDALIRSLLDGSYRPNPVKRVEIPKDNGKMRLLGISTVIDRLVQQAINQTLTPIYERQFSSRSYGFRPRRGCHDALRCAQKIVDDGYIYVVDLDLERFFDTVSHSKLIEILSRTIKDGRVISLIHKYLHSGVMNKGMFEASEEGTPQGGPLSPLLSNVMLNELDRELTNRGLPFVRYADDSMIFCKSKRAARRVKESVYMHQCGGHLQPVLDTLLAMQKTGVHLEITNLLIPGVNDSEKMIREMCRWLVSNGFAQNPLHFSRFFPLYKMRGVSPTPKDTLYLAKRIALKEGMESIYLGNI